MLVTNAAGIVTIKVSGHAGVTVSQTDPTTARIGQVDVTGSDSRTTLTITVKKANRSSNGLVEIGMITMDGDLATIAGSAVNIVGGGISITGRAGSVNLNSLSNSTLTVGGALGAVIIKNFANRHVLASQISKVNLSTVTTSNGGVPFGIQSPAINSVTVKSPKGFKWKKAGPVDQSLVDFHVQKQ